MATKKSSSVDGRVEYEDRDGPYYSRFTGEFISRVRFIGSRDALISRGLILDVTPCPKGAPGCIEDYSAGTKISMLRDGRLRVALDGPVAAQRDQLFRAFMRTVTERPAGTAS